MESDILDKYAAARPEARPAIKALYNDAVDDLATTVREATMGAMDTELRALGSVAEAAVRYAREFTRDQDLRTANALRMKAETRLSDALHSWQSDQEDRAAKRVAEQKAAREAQERAKKEERRRRREAKKAKLAADGPS